MGSGGHGVLSLLLPFETARPVAQVVVEEQWWCILVVGRAYSVVLSACLPVLPVLVVLRNVGNRNSTSKLLSEKCHFVFGAMDSIFAMTIYIACNSNT